MREIGDLVLDGGGYLRFRICTTAGWLPGCDRLCRVGGGMVYFLDKYAGIERGFNIRSFAEWLTEADDEVSGTGEAKQQQAEGVPLVATQ